MARSVRDPEGIVHYPRDGVHGTHWTLCEWHNKAFRFYRGDELRPCDDGVTCLMCVACGGGS